MIGFALGLLGGLGKFLKFLTTPAGLRVLALIISLAFAALIAWQVNNFLKDYRQTQVQNAALQQEVRKAAKDVQGLQTTINKNYNIYRTSLETQTKAFEQDRSFNRRQFEALGVQVARGQTLNRDFAKAEKEIRDAPNAKAPADTGIDAAYDQLRDYGPR